MKKGYYPAFPVDSNTVLQGREISEDIHGMSLRDYFAAKALPTLVATPVYWVNDGYPHPEAVAKAAYEIADAMLKAREI